MNERELSLRRALSIPDHAGQVLILEQSAHCDWDWIATFPVYYGVGGAGHQAVRDTFLQAIGYIGSSTEQQPYTYVFCEVAYLQAFVNDPTVTADSVRALKSLAGQSFLFSSGGITSAENLTVHTEAFIRNYLVGRQWLWDTFGVTASNQMWIPDDFGHDAQLPALLQAMGFTGAAFERIPAQANAGAGALCPPTINAADFAASSFLPDVGLDFIWQAADGSQVQAHWLMNGYCEGNGQFGAPPMIANGMSAIHQLIKENTHGLKVPTPYLFVPIDCDFCVPYSNLPQVVAQWNAAPLLPTTVVMASFDDFIQLVAAANNDGDALTIVPANAVKGNEFVPHPYYSGCYGSKPFIKTTHYRAVRTLLLAESMQLVLPLLGRWYADTASQMVATAWNSIAPSTHHDFITGTAPNMPQSGNSNAQDVYGDEQVIALTVAQAQAKGAQGFVLSQIADAVAPAGSAGNLVVIANSLGFTRTAVAELEALLPGTSYLSSTVDSTNYTPVQSNGSGGLLIQAEVGALGYTTATLAYNEPTVTTGLSASQATANAPVTMTNGSISAVIDTTGITSLTNPADPTSPSYLNGTGNEIVFYTDTGNIYRFANEMPCDGGTFKPDTSMVLTGATITLTEKGPLRATAVVSGGTIGGNPFTITYQLYATDTALRITVTGAAASGYSVMARFPFANEAAKLTYGTTAHWDRRAPREFLVPGKRSKWPSTLDQMTFEPTHEFVAALDAGDHILGAIYHYATPGWAIDPTGAVIGCILRNTPGTQNAASGSDFGVHTVSYAVALPVGLVTPDQAAWGTGAMLGAALDIHNPLAAALIPTSGAATLPASMSIASTTNTNVLLTVAKEGTAHRSKMILRLYQPTNKPISGVTVQIDSAIANRYQVPAKDTLVAHAVTALEQPSNQNLNLSTTADTVTLDLPFAITTVALGI